MLNMTNTIIKEIVNIEASKKATKCSSQVNKDEIIKKSSIGATFFVVGVKLVVAMARRLRMVRFLWLMWYNICGGYCLTFFMLL